MAESVIDIIKRLDPNFPVDELLRECGGRAWHLPKRDWDALRVAIQSEPRRDAEAIVKLKRALHVSRDFIYKCWRAA